MQAAVQEKPEEPHGVGGFERVSYSNPLGRRSLGPQAQVRAPVLSYISYPGPRALEGSVCMARMAAPAEPGGHSLTG